MQNSDGVAAEEDTSSSSNHMNLRLSRIQASALFKVGPFLGLEILLSPVNLINDGQGEPHSSKLKNTDLESDKELICLRCW